MCEDEEKNARKRENDKKAPVHLAPSCLKPIFIGAERHVYSTIFPTFPFLSIASQKTLDIRNTIA